MILHETDSVKKHLLLLTWKLQQEVLSCPDNI